ncbi:MAG: hypothetical protein IKY79_03250 [Bacteroidales bacterium]|nr:hypothetical protein [Bacteroidales bacterium]
MKKTLLISLIAGIVGMISACHNNNTTIEAADDTPITIDSIATKDTDTTIINNTEAETDKKNLDKPSYVTEIEIPLYKFKNEELHNRIKNIIDTGSIKSAHTISIKYFPKDEDWSISDSVTKIYNLCIETVGLEVENVIEKKCCMIGDKFCYINDNATIKRLFTKTGKTQKRKVYTGDYWMYFDYIFVEDWLLLYLDDNDSITYIY